MTGNRYTILVVDDVPDDIMILDEILKKDYQVKAVTSGEAALKIARSDNPPDLILLDIIMPEMDGFEVCRRLKEDARGTTIPVIFLTAKVMSADEKLGLELGAVDYIKKPIDPEIVKTRIKTHLEQKDQALRSSEVRFRRLFETSMDGIMIVDNESGMIVDVNPSMATILGLSQEYFLGKRISDLDFLKKILSQKDGFPGSRQGKYVRYKDQPMKTVDGRLIYIEFVHNSYSVNNRQVMQLNIRDITDLVLAEHERDELASKLSHYLSTSPTVTYSMVLKDGDARWQWVSENIRTILGYSSEEALVPEWWFKNIHAVDRAGAMGAIIELGSEVNNVREYRFTRKDKSCVWLRDEMRVVRDDGQEPEIVGTLTDISVSKKAEERLKALLLEKSELLREIHHRVNNNVQIMMSLLNISSEQLNDTKLRTKLDDITRRMQSMAIIHQQFYESEDMARIDFAVFLRQLLDSLKSGYPGISEKADSDCTTGEVFLSLDQAVPAGLIVNELLTNAMKFAFADKRSSGKIMLTQRLNDGMLEVEVQDNGIGLPTDIDPRHAQSMGMVLIQILAEQLDGKVEFLRGQGTDAVLRFALKSHPTGVITTRPGIWTK